MTFALRALRRHIVLILVTFVVVTGAGIALGHYWPKTYTSKAQILLGLDIANSNIDPQTANLYLKDRALTYAQLVTADEVLDPVAASTGTPADLLREQVVGSIVPETVVLGVSATGTTPEQAVALTQAVSGSFMTQVSSLNLQTGGPAILPAQLASPQPAIVPDQLHGKMLIVVAVLVGLLVAGLLALVLGLVDASRDVGRATIARQEEPSGTGPSLVENDRSVKEAPSDDLPQVVNGPDRRGRPAYLTLNPARGYPQRRDRTREPGVGNPTFERQSG